MKIVGRGIHADVAAAREDREREEKRWVKKMEMTCRFGVFGERNK